MIFNIIIIKIILENLAQMHETAFGQLSQSSGFFVVDINLIDNTNAKPTSMQDQRLLADSIKI